MGLIKSKGNMYDFVNDTINPIGGACPHKCKYCYVNRMKRKFPVIKEKYSGEIRLDEKVLKKNLKRGLFYFVQSMGDLFAENVPESIIMRVFDWLNRYPNNTYLLQSKNPKRFMEFNFPKNMVLGTTLESNRDYEGMSKAPIIVDRISAMIELRKKGCRTMVTIEPVLKFDVFEMVDILKIIKPEWINLGADPGGHKLPEPSKEELLELIRRVPIKQKKNLTRLLN